MRLAKHKNTMKTTNAHNTFTHTNIQTTKTFSQPKTTQQKIETEKFLKI